MKSKRTSHDALWWNIVEIHHNQKNPTMISSGWREEPRPMLANQEKSLKFIMLKEILMWSHLDEDKK